MVTKLGDKGDNTSSGLILAKIHMVTKHNRAIKQMGYGLILAKIHMVTKLITMETAC